MAVYQSPCKVNFILNILGRREDGFHDLETLFFPVPLYDRIEINLKEKDFGFSCNSDKIPNGSDNLVYRAAACFFQQSQIKPQGHIRLIKNLPSEAGIGGGSANAAITLKALNQEFGCPLGQSNLLKIAAQLGSDVPFFLLDHPAIGYGRGEKLEELPHFRSLEGIWIVLIKPDFGVSTGWAYKALAQYPEHLNGISGRAKQLADILSKGTLQQARDLFYNSLEAPVFEKYPILAKYQEFLLSLGAEVVLMSGSGSTTFALISDVSIMKTLPIRFRGEFGGNIWIESVQL